MPYEFNASEVFQMAIDIEENGRAFYEKAQEKVQDPAVKQIFGSLARAEVEHKEKFASLKAQLPPSASESTLWDPQNELDKYLQMMADMNVFRPGQEIEQMLAGIKDAADALRLAIQFEKDSIVFFLTMQEAADKKHGRELIGQLIREEQQHLKELSLKLREMVK